MYKLLDHINAPADLKKLNPSSLESVCAELRAFLIDRVLSVGGHFSANLGTVELTVALHYVLNTPNDQLVWDVGHQAYGHKILTGRKGEFDSIRKKGGLSGFPNRAESVHDQFGAGHSSTSISAILGMAMADKILNISRHHVAVIGDGSLTAGMAWESLNNAPLSNTNVLIIINDNNMGIDPNTGALNQYLNSIQKGTSNFFNDLGFVYFGPDDGHNCLQLVSQLNELLQIDGPKIWHLKTVKGKGYAPAEAEQTKWHSVKYVKIKEGDETPEVGEKFQEVFGQTLLELALGNDKVVGVTPAMPSGCSMNIMMEALPHRAFDVGIAEQHAVTFAAGMALNGLIPFCNLYSTFAQRAYDQIIHDVCIQNLPVIFCLDRAGAVGEDGATHQGMYDLAFLRCLPHLTIACPSDEIELRQMMFTALSAVGPMVIRYPKGHGNQSNWKVPFQSLQIGKGRRIKAGEQLAVLCLGTLVYNAEIAAQSIAKDYIAVYDMRFAKPLDEELLHEVFAHYSCIVTVEDGILEGGFGSSILEFASDYNYRQNIHRLGFGNQIVEHANREEQLEDAGLSPEKLTETFLSLLPDLTLPG